MHSLHDRVTAVAHPNIALIKYWGKRDRVLNLPDAGSVSITLDSLTSTTTASLAAEHEKGTVTINGQADPQAARKVLTCVNNMLTEQSDLPRMEIESLIGRLNIFSENNFPTAAGLASSASGFAALVTAIDTLFSLGLTDQQRSVHARRGSGSAARSLFGGFVRMFEGEQSDGSDAYAQMLHEASHWPLEVIIAVTSTQSKKTGSTDGMQASKSTSPYHQAWVDSTRNDIEACVTAIAERDFTRLATLSEHSCLKMHASMMATQPPLLYWNPATLACVHRIVELRASGLDVFFTIDAGPQVKAICLPSSSEAVKAALSDVHGVAQLMHTRLGQAAESRLDQAA